MQVLGEVGGPLQIPSPAIRVPAETEVKLTIRNTAGDGPPHMHGLYDRPVGGETIVTIAPGETRQVSFRLSTPSTYYYWGSQTDKPMSARMGVDLQLSGAIVVDPAGAKPDPKEEIFVITEWLDAYRTNGAPVFSAALAVINGRSWPRNQRLTYTQGEPVKWRWINLSMEDHPLHLHGFYFRVVAAPTRRAELIRPAGTKPEESWWSTLASILPSMPTKRPPRRSRRCRPPTASSRPPACRSSRDPDHRQPAPPDAKVGPWRSVSYPSSG